MGIVDSLWHHPQRVRPRAIPKARNSQGNDPVTARNLEQRKIDPKEATAMANLCGRLLEAIQLEQDHECALLVNQLREVLAAQAAQKAPGAQEALVALSDTAN